MAGGMVVTNGGESKVQGEGKRRWEEPDRYRDNQDDLDLDFFRGDEPSPCSAARFFRTGATATV